MVENPYGIEHFWQQGDVITHTVAIILISMSVISWFIILLKAWQLLWLRRCAEVAETRFWHSKDFEEGVALLGGHKLNNPFRALAEDSVNSALHHEQNREDLHGALNMNEWLTSCLRRSTDNIANRLQRGLPFLASIGSTAPFVGLFGTVWGIYHALIGIGATGQTSIDRIAGPIGEALIMTAFGLVVAIPAVLGYNALIRAQKAMLVRTHNFAHDLHAYFVTGKRVTQKAVVNLRATPAPVLKDAS
ncbi:MAG: Biopolymer transport protein ExbB [Pseudomonadota bacterium]|jgi:biopolymer transport protein ExbB